MFVMRFSIILNLCFNFLLCHQVSSSRYSIVEDQPEKVLDIFFDQFNKAYLQKQEPPVRQVVIVGASTPEFKLAVQPLFESSPFLIFTDLKLCEDSKSFRDGTFFVVFLKDFGEENINRTAEILSSCRTECKLIYVFKGTIVKSDEILSYLIKLYRLGGICEFLHLGNNVVKHYGLNFAENCSVHIDSRFIWRPGTDLTTINTFLFRERRDLHGCSVSVGGVSYLPELIIEENENSRSTIVGGRDGILISTIAKKLNFTIAIKLPRVSDGVDVSRKLSMLKDVESGNIEFAMGRFRQTVGYTFSVPFDTECITFAVPRKISTTAGNIIWREFTWRIWFIIGFIFAIGCVLEYIRRSMIPSEDGNRQDSGFVSIVLDVVSIHLGYAVLHLPFSASGKFVFVVYLGYAIIVTTAYRTSFTSILTTAGNPAITDSQGIIDANLKLGGSAYNLKSIIDEAGTSEVKAKLIERYEVCGDHSMAMHRLKVDGDFAYFARRSYLIYEKRMAAKTQEYFSFDILNECVLTYSTVLAFRNGSHLLNPVNEIILRLAESDILEYWDHVLDYNDVETFERDNSYKISGEHMAQKFNTIFICYCCCLVVCTLVFVAEILVARFKSPKTPQVDRRDILL